MAFINYEMEIQGLTTLLFPITPKFFPKIDSTWKRDGKQAKAIDSVPVEGWFSENDQDVLNAKQDELRALSKNGAPMVFIFRKEGGGDEVFRIDRGHIQNLEEVESDGGRANHIQFRFNITEEKGVTFAGLVDFTRSDRTTTRLDADGSVRVILQRRVSATGLFGNLVPARNFVLGLKPDIGNITSEVIDDESFDGVVVGTWDSDITEEAKGELSTRILRWTERATTKPGLENVRWFRTQGAPFPIEGGLGQTAILVTGTIKTFSLADMPTVQDIIGPFLDAAQGDTGPHIVDAGFEPARGVEFDTDDPVKPTVFQRDYSFTIEFGEEPAEPLTFAGLNPIGVGRPIGGSQTSEEGGEGASGGASGVGSSFGQNIVIGGGTPQSGP